MGKLRAGLMAIFGDHGDTNFNSNSKVPYFNNMTLDGVSAFFPDGLSSVQKFAEVLGVAQYHTFLLSGSFNDLIVPGTWLCTPGTMNDRPSDIPSGNGAQAILEVIKLGTTGLHVLQRLTSKGTGEVYIRCNNSTASPYTWYNWNKQ